MYFKLFIILIVSDDEIKNYIIEFIFNDRVLDSIGRENVGMWMPFVESKINNIVNVTKNLDVNVRSKVLGVVATKIQKLILGINDAVRSNYAKGEDEILRSIINLLSRGML
ncbi:MAG: hypothetical protein ACK4F9_02925 [Brevinematia bacterium]